MDSDGQLTFEDDLVTIRYKQCFQHIIRYDFRTALEKFRELEPSLAKNNVRQAIRIMEFWSGRKDKISRSGSDEEELKAWQAGWKDFEVYYKEQRLEFPELFDQMKRLSLARISELLIRRFQKLDVPDVDLLCELGWTFMEMKDYDRASETLLYGVRLAPLNAVVLGYLSDAVYFLSDAARSRLYLREAFLSNCDGVPVDRLRSPLIREIRYQTEQEGYQKFVQRWMPVVATCHNIFSAKRPLTAEEVGRLEEECREMEAQFQADHRQQDALRPLIVFRTLVLMDHLLLDGRIGGARMTQYEVRLRKYDEKMYALYVKNVIFNGEEHDG